MKEKQIKVLVVSLQFYPELTGIGKYSGEMSEYLTQMGHSIRVLTTKPFYPGRKIFPGYSRWRFQREILDSHYRIYRVPILISASGRTLSRLLEYMSFFVSSLVVVPSLVNWRPDRVVVIVPTLLSVPLAWLFKFLCKSRTWLHIQDLEFEAISVFSGGSSKILKWLNLFEGIFYRGFDTISSISPSMLNRIKEKAPTNCRYFIFPNWTTLQGSPLAEPPQPMRRRFSLQDEDFVVLYSGNLGRKQGIRSVVAASERLRKSPRIKFLFCGEGPEKEFIVSYFAENPNHSVNFYGLVPDTQLRALLAMADAHLVPQKANLPDSFFPSKLTNILSIGGWPIVSADKDSELGRFAISHPDFSSWVPAEDPDALAKEIERLSKEMPPKPNANALVYSEKYLSKSAILSEFLERLVVEE